MWNTVNLQTLVALGLLSAWASAQSVGIGTAVPDPSARLHISDNARGLLIPNVALTATNNPAPVAGPATSLLVYNTATAGAGATAVTPGFYYWNGNQWVRLVDGISQAWLLTGNAGTNPAVNFLGTTDNQPLHIRVDNLQTFQYNTNLSLQRDAGGDPRGIEAVDLQVTRFSASSVASGDYSVVVGGGDNQASGNEACVVGGLSNIASGNRSTIGGGVGNVATGYSSIIGGGSANTAAGTHATVGGGESNRASSHYATISGGESNRASGLYATIGGGQNDTASGHHATIGGGLSNTASGGGATIGGGSGNTASGAISAIGGGSGNTASGQYVTIGGGVNNEASGQYTTISGGANNEAIGSYATIGGGINNEASGPYTTIGGGWDNTANGDRATIGGGYENTASGLYATVSGGWINRATGDFSTVSGGIDNEVSGFYSAVVGGAGNRADGNFNLIFGNAVVPSVTEDHRVYLFEPFFSGFLVLNRLDGDHPIHVGTNGFNGNDAYLTAGGTWTNASSRSLKDRFRPLYPQEVLQKILAMRVEGWYYKGTEEYHIGPYAEDFYAAFGTGVANENDAQTHLAASDVAGVSLLGIQALHKENDSLRRRVSYLETENAALRARLDRLESLVEKIASTQANP